MCFLPTKLRTHDGKLAKLGFIYFDESTCPILYVSASWNKFNQKSFFLHTDRDNHQHKRCFFCFCFRFWSKTQDFSRIPLCSKSTKWRVWCWAPLTKHQDSCQLFYCAEYGPVVLDDTKRKLRQSPWRDLKQWIPMRKDKKYCSMHCAQMRSGNQNSKNWWKFGKLCLTWSWSDGLLT